MTDSYGVTLAPEDIAELLDEGLIEFEQDDGSHVILMYETVPKMQSEGWNE